MPPEHKDSGQTLSPQTSFDEVTQPTSISVLFNHATLYKQALVGTSDGRLSPEPPLQNPALRSVQDFAELVGDDLEPPEQDVVGRFAQLVAEDSDWNLEENERDEDPVFSEEPAALTDADREKLVDSYQDVELGESEHEPEETQLSPERVIALLTEEFGHLAPEGEETLILEADGAVMQDVVILVRCHCLSDCCMLRASSGRDPSHDPSHRIPRFYSRVRSKSARRRRDKSRPCARASHGMAS